MLFDSCKEVNWTWQILVGCIWACSAFKKMFLNKHRIAGIMMRNEETKDKEERRRNCMTRFINYIIFILSHMSDRCKRVEFYWHFTIKLHFVFYLGQIKSPACWIYTTYGWSMELLALRTEFQGCLLCIQPTEFSS